MRLTWIDKDTGAITELRFDVVSKESVDSVLNITKHPVEVGADVVDHAHKEPGKISIEGYVSNKPLPSNPGVYFGDVGPNGPLLKPASIALDYGDMNTQPVVSPAKVDLDYSNQNPDRDIALSLNTLVNAIGGAVASLLGKGPPTSFQGFSGVGQHKIPTRYVGFKGVDGFENRARAMYTALAAAQESRALITVDIMLVTLSDMMIGKLSAPRMAADGNGATFNLDLEEVRLVSSETVDAPVPAEASGAKQKSAGTKHGSEDEAAKAAEKDSILDILLGGSSFLGLKKLK